MVTSADLVYLIVVMALLSLAVLALVQYFDKKNVLWSGKYIRIARKGTWEYVERVGSPSAAIIFPFVVDRYGDKEMVLIKEWRVPLQQYVIGVPAGLVGDHNPEEEEAVAAVRELEEETGYTGKLKYLFHGPSSSGLTNEMLYFYLGYDLTKVSEGGGTNDEDIEVFTIPVRILYYWLEKQTKRGNLIDPKIYIGLDFLSQNGDLYDGRKKE